MNKENLKALAKKLRRLRHEEHYNQGKWVSKTACGTAACIAGHAALLAGYKPRKIQSESCGDEACCPSKIFIDAEHMVKAGEVVSVEDIARKFLGLKEDKANRLFSGSPEQAVYTHDGGVRHGTAWPAEFADRWAAAVDGESKERPSRIAADLLDAIAEGTVKL